MPWFKWPEDLSPYLPVARLRLPAQRFDSAEQLDFADVLRYNPWHSRPEHRPLGNSNRARKQMYWKLARLRQAMNQVEHIEPTWEEQSRPSTGTGHQGQTLRYAGPDGRYCFHSAGVRDRRAESHRRVAVLVR